MTKLIKYQLLKQFQLLKSFGYSYHENFEVHNNEIKNFTLPNNIEDLNECINHCYLCELSKSRKKVLNGQGNINSKIMFITEEPTSSEDELGVFFVGKSGELLSNMIEKVLNIKKEDIYITSLVKCRSINGINYSNYETCSDYLQKQIDIINPSLIVLLGEKTYSYLLKNSESFSQNRGKELFYKKIKVVSTYSPSFLLRNPSLKKEAYYDMLRVKNILESLN